jgi:hypothetical protein
MKKTLILTIMVMVVLGTTPVTAKNLNFGVEAGYFGPNDSNFSAAYGSGGTTFGVNAGYRFIRNVSIQAGYNFYNADSTTALSEEKIGIKLGNLRIGGYYHFNLKKVMPKAGAGLAVTWVKENDPFGGTDTAKAGWFVGAGIDVPVGKKFLTGVELLYNNVKISGEFGSAAIGGFSLMLNLKLKL